MSTTDTVVKLFGPRERTLQEGLYLCCMVSFQQMVVREFGGSSRVSDDPLKRVQRAGLKALNEASRAIDQKERQPKGTSFHHYKRIKNICLTAARDLLVWTGCLKLTATHPEPLGQGSRTT